MSCSCTDWTEDLSFPYQRKAKEPEVNLVYGDLTVRGIGFVLNYPTHDDEGYDSSNTMAHVAGATAVGLSYAAAGALVAIDGPLPFADMLGLGILAVPDVVWYGIGYSLVA
jgi:hypothetical protein